MTDLPIVFARRKYNIRRQAVLYDDVAIQGN
jgi:hypothetical protein